MSRKGVPHPWSTGSGRPGPLPRKRDAWPFLLSLLLTAAVYLPRLSAPLSWDDRHWILENPALDGPISLGRYLTPDYFEFSRESTWRPLATLSYQAMIRAAGKSPLPLRAAGFIIHLVDAALLAAILITAGMSPGAGALAGALFLIHPAHSETLMCVAFNEELLCSLGLLTMLFFHQKKRWPLAMLGLTVALLSKEPGALGLPIAALYDWTQKRRKPWKIYLGYSLITGLYLWVRFVLLRGPGGDADLSSLLPLGERLLYASRGFAAACRVFFLPLSLRIEYFALPAGPGPAAGVFCLALLLFWLRRLYKTDRTMFLFLLWPLAFLSLTSNILPTGVLSTRYLAERWLYLPYIGASAVLGGYMVRRPLAAAALLCLWGTLGWSRVGDWSCESRLWESLAEVYPWCSKAHEGLGGAFFREGRDTQALAEFETALRTRLSREDLVLRRYIPLAPPGTLDWESPSLYRWLGLSHLELHEDAKAREMLEKANVLDPADGFTYRALAYLSARAGRFDAARDWLEKGLRRSPSDDFLLRLGPDISRRHLSFHVDFR